MHEWKLYLYRNETGFHLWTMNTHEKLDDVILAMSDMHVYGDQNRRFGIGQKLVFLGLQKIVVSI